MIKYNNKELFANEVPTLTHHINSSHQSLHKNTINNQFYFLDSSQLHHHTSFQSPNKQLLLNNYHISPVKRSKSHKINIQGLQRGKLKNDLLKKRQKSKKLELLVILPSETQPKTYNNNHPTQKEPTNLPLMNDKSIIRNISPIKDIRQKKEQCKSSIKDDIACGKMRLLTHKSKLTPIKQLNTKESIDVNYKEQHKDKITTYQNKFIQKRQKQVRQQYLSNQKSQYIRLIDQINPKNIINIHSIHPNYTITNKLSLQLKQKRRITQPNLEQHKQFNPSQQPYIDLHNNLHTQTKINLTSSELNFHQKRTYAHKFITNKLKKKIIFTNIRKFIIPFETYYYRDFLWKINYSNKLYIEPPLQYQHRLKVYVGKGNNSSMVRGLINRRYWFAFTERIQDANFLWTQLKQLKYFRVQKSLVRNKDDMKEQSKVGGNYTPYGLLLNEDIKEYKKYFDRHRILEEHSDERLLPRSKHFKYRTILKGPEIRQGRLHNHLINNYTISNKKSLFRLLSAYYNYHSLDPFLFIPLTFHIRYGLQDPSFLAFQRYYHQQAKSIRKGQSQNGNLWIVKPGENSNRGNGIKVCLKLSEIKAAVRQGGHWGDGSDRTYIIQYYIEKPLLYYRRKFDLRHYMLMTCINGQLKGYWYLQGYVRTTSSEYSLETASSNVHLTNDAVQKHLPNYGKYQKGNKLSYSQLDAYIHKKFKQTGFYSHIYPQMKRIAIDIMKASSTYLDPSRLSNNFQLFGLDYMIDQKLKVWLIQVNSNPCLQLSCPLLSMIIPNLIENVLELTIDTLYPPAIRYNAKIPRYLGQIQKLNKFQLVFDQDIQNIQPYSEQIIDNKLLEDQESQFQDNQAEWQDNL